MPTTTTVYTNKDTFLNERRTTQNDGSATTMSIGTAYTFGSFYKYNAVLSFDVSGITDPASITQANLNLEYVSSVGSTTQTVTLARLNENFTETEADWIEYENGVSWTGGAGAFGNAETTQPTYTFSVGSGVSADVTIDIKDLVIDAILRRSGTLLLVAAIDGTPAGAANGYTNFATKEHASKTCNIVVSQATKISWVGTVSGDVGNALNWSTGGVPTGDDFALFNTGSADVTTGTLTCDSCKVGKNYRGTIGTSLSFIEVRADKFTLASPHAGIYVSLNDGIGTNTELRIIDAAANDRVHFKSEYDATISRSRGTIALQTADVDRIDAHGRRVKFTADDDVAVIRCTGGSAVLNDGGAAITLVDANVTIDRVNFDESEITVAGSSRVRMLSDVIHSLTQYSGSTSFADNIGAPFGLGDEMFIYAGVVDTRTYAATSSTLSCNVYGGRLLIDASQTAAIA